tara:strand:- start:5845 stop:6957 length:1113 start_codon:yes stop_codon:yes gene_type:complete
MKKILFFYQAGRIEKINNNTPYAKEMFYGYHYFESKGYDTEIIEFDKSKKFLNKYYFLIFEKRLRNILKLPIYWSFLTNKKNIKKIFDSDYAIFSNNRVGFASLINITISKIIRKKPSTLCFVMGLFSRTPKFKILQPVQKFLLNYFLKNMDNLIFLSESEQKHAANLFKKHSKKMHVLPFAVDLQIWKVSKSIEKKKKILFVGNDGFRDFEFAKNLANSMYDKEFVFVTNQLNQLDLKDNSVLHKGSWSKNSLTDLELANLYNEAFLTIVPLVNSLQPSGQSVSLQSIACGTPVIITDTDGFWDKKNFENENNIILANQNSIGLWSDLIKKLENDHVLYNNIRGEGLDLIKNKYNLDNFSKSIENIIIK